MDATWWTKPEQLDDDQKDVLALDKDGDHLIIGPPGSGKTNLLLLRAAFLYKLNRRDFVVLTYGRVLKEFLATGVAHYPFEVGRLKTFAAWASALSRQFDLPVPDIDDETASRQVLLENLQKIAASGKPVVDCILIDECQDYTPEELNAMCDVSNNVFCVGDDRQEIFGRRGGLQHLAAIMNSVIYLKAHYRNGRKICRVADSIQDQLDDANGLEASSQYDEAAFPSTVAVYAGLSMQEQVEAAADELSNQLVAYPAGFLGVLCPRNADLTKAAEMFGKTALSAHIQLQQYSAGYSALDPQRRVLLTTLHGAKGLEFRAVHLLAGEQISCFQEKQKRVAYMSVTRAKTYLALYHDSALPGFLDAAATCAEMKAVPDPKLEDLFL